MKKVALIVEGKGDVQAIPSLIAKIAYLFQLQIFVADPPIKAGEAKKLMRSGELERHLQLANSRAEVEEILLVVDLDDGCAAHFAKLFRERADAISNIVNKPVHFCFCLREYEVWFLSEIATLRITLPEYGIEQDANFIAPEKIRGAKEALRNVCKARGYKQMRDQLVFTKKIDVKQLALRDRSFRKLVKCVTSLGYDDIIKQCSA